MEKLHYSQKLKEIYQNISKLAYELLEVTDEPIRQVHEDGVSSIFLKKIASLKKHGFYVKTKSLKVNERKTGVDFDLWIGENDKNYVRFTVQAKSFGNNTKTSQKYDIDEDQCDKIIKHSENTEHQSYPLYFLYQYIIDKDLKEKHFSFLDDFEDELSSITFSSAYNIQKLIANQKLKFSDIHENKIKNKWRNQIYDLFENNEKVGLPIYLLHDLSPSRIKKFQKLTSLKNTSLGFFFFFPFGDNPIKIHRINAKKIEEKLGSNRHKNFHFKKLLIINDSNKSFRDNMNEIEEKLG